MFGLGGRLLTVAIKFHTRAAELRIDNMRLSVMGFTASVDSPWKT
jgi:hypothetical protein